MFEDSKELAENKLIILYILDKIKFPIENKKLTQIILEENLISYFSLQGYITELIGADFISIIEEENKKRLTLSEKGKKVLSLFQNRINFRKKDSIDSYLQNQLENIRKDITISAEYTIEKGENFIVNLKAYEDKIVLIDIKLSVASNKQAREICNLWRENSSSTYSEIIKLLTNS